MDDGIKEYSLYQGRVKVKFYGPTPDKPNRHMYYVSRNGGKASRVPGVTTVNVMDKSTALLKWTQEITVDFMLRALDEGKVIDHDLAIEAAVQNEIQKQEAADLGTLIHAWCEQYIKHKIKIKGITMPEMPEDERVMRGVMSFLDWEKQHKVKFLSSERVVYSLKYGYIGTMDIEAMIGKEKVLVDIKSSNGLYNGVRLQTAAYVRADEEEGASDYAGRWALRVSKLTEEQHKEKQARKQEIKDFIAKSRGWQPKEAVEKPYQVFEAKYLDAEEGFMDRDFKAFRNNLELYNWNKATDPFLAGADW